MNENNHWSTPANQITHRRNAGDLGGVTGNAKDKADDEAEMHERFEIADGVVSPCPLGAPAPASPGDSRTRGLSSGSRM